MENNSLDILAFGIHPDDVELGCGGTLAKHHHLGYKIGICDLTRGEMGTRGDASTRMIEANKAKEILGVDIRINLEMEDVWALDSNENCLKIIEVIRTYRPKIILTNSDDHRHPDHKKGAAMVQKAAFLSGLTKIVTKNKNLNQEAHRPQNVYQYIQARMDNPHFVVDISDWMEVKLNSILAYSTQFYNPQSKEPETFISDKNFLELIKAKDLMAGKIIGVQYAEGFLTERHLGVSNLMDLI